MAHPVAEVMKEPFPPDGGDPINVPVPRAWKGTAPWLRARSWTRADPPTMAVGVSRRSRLDVQPRWRRLRSNMLISLTRGSAGFEGWYRTDASGSSGYVKGSTRLGAGSGTRLQWRRFANRWTDRPFASGSTSARRVGSRLCPRWADLPLVRFHFPDFHAARHLWRQPADPLLEKNGRSSRAGRLGQDRRTFPAFLNVPQLQLAFSPTPDPVTHTDGEHSSVSRRAQRHDIHPRSAASVERHKSRSASGRWRSKKKEPHPATPQREYLAPARKRAM